MENFFEYAAINKLRFPSSKGDLTVEQLYELPLQSTKGVDLDTVARTVYQLLQDVAQGSFVATASNPAKKDYEVKLEIVKHVIGSKQEDNAKKARAASNRAERERLTQLLANKQDAELLTLSREELEKRIKQLED